MMSDSLANRLGFAVLGLTNNFAYVIMLSAAYDLLDQSSSSSQVNPNTDVLFNATISIRSDNNITQEKKYCNEHSTSTVLLADTLPSLSTKIIYPFLLVGLPTAYKAIVTAILSAAAFLVTGMSTKTFLIFTGVICASFSSGLGEVTFLSNTPLYGDVSLSGWSMGTGAAGLVGSAAYAILRFILPIKFIMIIMLIVPVAMMAAYFYMIRPLVEESGDISLANSHSSVTTQPPVPVDNTDNSLTTLQPNKALKEEKKQEQNQQQPPVDDPPPKYRDYGTSNDEHTQTNIDASQLSNPFASGATHGQLINQSTSATPLLPFDFQAKLHYIPSLAKYFLPLLLVYFAEYFINQGLFELIYYPEITYLDHSAQYSMFQVCYQLGVVISRSSLDFIQINNLWAMSMGQVVNALIFLAHASKLIHIPNFYLVLLVIIFEGLLGGFTYVNTFYRIKKEVAPERQEFGISCVTMADSLGIVMAGLVALPVHDSLCRLYI